MSAVNFLSQKASRVGKIMQNKPGFRTAYVLGLFFSYVRLILKYLIMEKLLRVRVIKADFFGFKMSFFDFGICISIFEEVFIDNPYWFRSGSKDPFIIDCGCNVGMSIIFFKKHFPGCRITGFEADKATFDMLKANVERNGLKDVTLINRALFREKNKEIVFYSSSTKPFDTKMNAISGGKNGLDVSQVVLTDTLSDYLDEKPDMVKMDIEGAETAVFEEVDSRGKFSLISNIVFEYHHRLFSADQNMSKILAILEKNGLQYQLGADDMLPFEGNKPQAFYIFACRKQI